MPPRVVERVFEPFFTTKPIGQGTGLGLSMVYGFVAQSRGQVRVSSEPGKGTAVRMYLPRQEAGPAEQEPASSPPAPRAGAGETVLVVEDDPVVRLLVTQVLNDLGYAALEAVDGAAAMPILDSRRRLDLMITDVGLPGINGRQLAEIARQRRPDLPVLFMTGYAKDATTQAAFLSTGMQIIAKPFGLADLAARIREMIKA
jgi:CheY-like chemotaxis protein